MVGLATIWGLIGLVLMQRPEVANLCAPFQEYVEIVCFEMVARAGSVAVAVLACSTNVLCSTGDGSRTRFHDHRRSNN